MFAVVLLLAVSSAVHAADQVIDDIGNEGAAILAASRLHGVYVRQCSCAEQDECTREMKAQADECSPQCFHHFNSITDRTADLKQCFDSKMDIVDNFINCFATRVDACVPDMNGPQIQKTDIGQVFTVGEKRLATSPSPTVQALLNPIKHYLDALGGFAACVKDCFLGKNSAGFCYDRKGCQPLINDHKAQLSLRTCTRKIQWKRQAGEICECSYNAGLTDLKQYCAMFKLMANRRHG